MVSLFLLSLNEVFSILYTQLLYFGCLSRLFCKWDVCFLWLCSAIPIHTPSLLLPSESSVVVQLVGTRPGDLSVYLFIHEDRRPAPGQRQGKRRSVPILGIKLWWRNANANQWFV